MKTQLVFRRMAGVALLGSVLMFGDLVRAQECSSETMDAHYDVHLTSPITSFVFWPPTRSDALNIWANWTNALGDPAFYERVYEYGVGMGRQGQFFVANTKVTGQPLNESWINNVLGATLDAANHEPLADENFVILMPNARTYAKEDSVPDSVGASHGHHDSFNHTFPNGDMKLILYSVIEYDSKTMPGGAGLDPAISHELYETFTDPILGAGWWDTSMDQATRGGQSTEIADICYNLNNTFFMWLNQYGMSMSEVYHIQNGWDPVHQVSFLAGCCY